MMKQDTPAETALAIEFGKGDEKAFADIYELYYDVLFFYAKSLTASVEDAEDIVGIVFEKLLLRNKKKGFDTLGNIRGFLWLTTRNDCLNFRKAKRSKIKLMEQFSILSPKEEKAFEIQSMKIESLAIFNKTIETLPKGCQEVFKLLFVEGLPTRDVAKELGIEEATVRKQKSLGLAILRKEFSKHQLVTAWLLYLSMFHNGSSIRSCVSVLCA